MVLTAADASFFEFVTDRLRATMIPQRIANLIFAVIMLIVAGYMAWLAWSFTTPALGGATLPTKFFPLVLLGFIAVSIGIYVFEYLTKGHSGEDGDEVVYAGFPQMRRGLLTLAVVLAIFWFWRDGGEMLESALGFKFSMIPIWGIAGLVLAPAVAFAMGARVWWHYIVLVACTLLIYAAFAYGLGTRFK